MAVPRGMALERLMTKGCYSARKRGVAFVRKIDIPCTITNRGLQLHCAISDYEGCLAGGRLVGVEAKETEDKCSFPLRQIKQHQLAYLLEVEKFGGLGYFVIHFKSKGDKAFLVPVEFISSRWEGEKRSVKYEEFDVGWLIDPEEFLDEIVKRTQGA